MIIMVGLDFKFTTYIINTLLRENLQNFVQFNFLQMKKGRKITQKISIDNTSFICQKYRGIS
jgi:hypothetical protein